MKRFLYGLALGMACSAAVLGALLPRQAAAQPHQDPLPPEGRSGAEGPAGNGAQDPAVRITPEMVRYSNTRYALYFGSALLNMLILLWLLESRISDRLRDLAEKKTGNGLLRAWIYYPLFTLAYGALTLPLSFYSSYLLPHQYGLSNQSLSGWIADGAKELGISAVVAPPVVAFLYCTIRRSPRRWWLGFWLASIPLMIGVILLQPIVIEPLFNRFGPLRNEALRQKILALAAKAGIQRSRVFEVDASRRTRGVNAYVTGLGGSARIVLWDTLLQKLDEDEVLFVMAHEMGHYVEGHVPILVAASILGSFVFLFLTDRGSRAVLARNGERWGIRGLEDLASFPLLLLVLAILNFFGSPAAAALSRTVERRADTFGLRVAGNGRAAASSFVKLSELNLSHPDPPPFVEFWIFTHPPLKERIEKALAWERRGD